MDRKIEKEGERERERKRERWERERERERERGGRERYKPEPESGTKTETKTESETRTETKTEIIWASVFVYVSSCLLTSVERLDGHRRKKTFDLASRQEKVGERLVGIETVGGRGLLVLAKYFAFWKEITHIICIFFACKIFYVLQNS